MAEMSCVISVTQPYMLNSPMWGPSGQNPSILQAGTRQSCESTATDPITIPSA